MQSPSFVEFLYPIAAAMTSPTFHSYLVLLHGWLFARRRTITGMILAAGAVKAKHFSSYHRVFAAASWSLDLVGLAAFGLVLPWLDGEVVWLSLDDTLARKRGLKVYGVGMHHDPLLSSRKVALVNWGHSWVVLAVIVRFPFRPEHYFSLPILFRLYRSRQTVAKEGGLYRTKPELALEMLSVLCKAHEKRQFHVIADSAYGGHGMVSRLEPNCDLTSRLHPDARLYSAPPPPTTKKRGRPRKRGERLSTPRQALKREAGKRITLTMYGRKERSRVVIYEARMHNVPDRPLRVVVVHPLCGGRRDQAFYSTDRNATAEQVLSCYAMRWSIEEAFHEAKGQLGFEEPQGWTKKAAERTAPTAMLLYGLVVLWFAQHGRRYLRIPKRPWYRHKQGIAFADMLAAIRASCLHATISQTPPTKRGLQKALKGLMKALAAA